MKHKKETHSFISGKSISNQIHLINKSPAHGGPALHCFGAGMGVDVDAGAVDGPQGAAAWETGSVIHGGASERGLGDGALAVHQDQVPAPWEAAGYKVSSPEEELGDGSSHLGGPATAHDGSAGGGGDDDDGGRLDGDDGDGGYCCCCSGGGGGSDGLSGHVVLLEGCGRRNR